MSQNDMNQKYLEMRKREKNRSRAIGLIIAGIVVFCVGFVGLYLLIVVGIALAVWGVVIITKNGSADEFKEFQEEYILPEILKERFELQKYTKKDHFPEDLMVEAGLAEGIDDIDNDDYIDAMYKGVHFKYSDMRSCHEEDHYDDDGNTTSTTVTTFKGQCFWLRTKLTLKGQIHVKEKGGKLFHKNVIKVDEGLFDKRYTTYSELDSSLVRTVLSPDVVNALMKLDSYAGSGNVLYVCFTGQDVIIGLKNNKNLFDSMAKDLETTKQKHRGDVAYVAGALDIIISSGLSFE